MNYTVDYFIEKFEAIPESEWCIEDFVNDLGQKCAQGHCGMTLRNCYQIWEGKQPSHKAYALVMLFGGPKIPLNVAAINNGGHPDYQQPTPKQRVLAALYDIKSKEIQISEVHEVLEKQTVIL